MGAGTIFRHRACAPDRLPSIRLAVSTTVLTLSSFVSTINVRSPPGHQRAASVLRLYALSLCFACSPCCRAQVQRARGLVSWEGRLLNFSSACRHIAHWPWPTDADWANPTYLC